MLLGGNPAEMGEKQRAVVVQAGVTSTQGGANILKAHRTHLPAGNVAESSVLLNLFSSYGFHDSSPTCLRGA